MAPQPWSSDRTAKARQFSQGFLQSAAGPSPRAPFPDQEFTSPKSGPKRVHEGETSLWNSIPARKGPLRLCQHESPPQRDLVPRASIMGLLRANWSKAGPSPFSKFGGIRPMPPRPADSPPLQGPLPVQRTSSLSTPSPKTSPRPNKKKAHFSGSFSGIRPVTLLRPVIWPPTGNCGPPLPVYQSEFNVDFRCAAAKDTPKDKNRGTAPGLRVPQTQPPNRPVPPPLVFLRESITALWIPWNQ